MAPIDSRRRVFVLMDARLTWSSVARKSRSPPSSSIRMRPSRRPAVRDRPSEARASPNSSMKCRATGGSVRIRATPAVPGREPSSRCPAEPAPDGDRTNESNALRLLRHEALEPIALREASGPGDGGPVVVGIAVAGDEAHLVLGRDAEMHGVIVGIVPGA